MPTKGVLPVEGVDRTMTGGPEHRYHYPQVDDARFDEATMGSRDDDNLSGEAECVPESCINTMDGPARGTLGGTDYPDDKWRSGF